MKLRFGLLWRVCWQAGAGVSEGGALRPGLQGMEELQTGSDAVPKRSCPCWDESITGKTLTVMGNTYKLTERRISFLLPPALCVIFYDFYLFI